MRFSTSVSLSVRNALFSTAILVTAASPAACKKDADKGGEATPKNATPGVEAVASAAPTASAPQQSFEEKVAASTALQPKPAPQEGGGVKLSAERCEIEGGPLLNKSNMEVLRSISVAGDKLYVADGEGFVRAYTVAPGAACKLTPDASFGEAGVLKTAGKVERVDSDTAGHLFASTGIFGSTRLTGGKADYKCDARPQGRLFVHPAGKMAVGTFANANVAKLSFDDKGCKSEPWAFTDMGDAAKRKGVFGMAEAVGFVGDMILVGGQLSKNVDPNTPHVVLGVDANGKEKIRFGKTDKASSEDRFGWIHAIGPCKPGICVLDSNYRRITFWKTDGTYVGFVKLDKLFDLDYPWIADFTPGKPGATYFVTGQERGKKSGVGEGNVYRVTGL